MVLGIILHFLRISTFLCSWGACVAYEQESSESSVATCSAPDNPSHGVYKCTGDNQKKTCRLRCNKGFVVPITDTVKGKVLQLKDRGVFRCETKDGVSLWTPRRFYDCVQEVHPTDIVYEYGLKMDTTGTSVDCTKGNRILNATSKQLLETLRTGTIKDLKYKNGRRISPGPERFELVAACTGATEVTAEITFYIPFKKEYHETRNLSVRVWSVMDDDIKTHIKITGQTQATKEDTFAFYYLCPKGTWVQQDGTCRGCSRGHYLHRKDMTCEPCPAGYFQNEDLQSFCKKCPKGLGARQEIGGGSVNSCFFPSRWITYADMFTLLSCLASVVLASSLFIYFRTKVTFEPERVFAESHHHLHGGSDGSDEDSDGWDDGYYNTMKAQRGSDDGVSRMKSPMSVLSESSSDDDGSVSSVAYSSDEDEPKKRNRKHKRMKNARRSTGRSTEMAARLYAKPPPEPGKPLPDHVVKSEAYRRISEQYRKESSDHHQNRKSSQKSAKSPKEDVDGHQKRKPSQKPAKSPKEDVDGHHKRKSSQKSVKSLKEDVDRHADDD